MYTVLHIKEIHYEMDDNTYREIHAYHCFRKSLAEAYLVRRHMRICKSLDKKNGKTVRITNRYMTIDPKTGSSVEGFVEYEPGPSEYPFVTEMFVLMRSKEILDLPNGPSLKVE